MSKYIIIVALALFAAASFVFYKTHTAIVSSGGEVTALHSQYETAIAKNKEIFVDETIAAFAKLRHEWLTQRKAELDAQKVQYEEEDVSYQGEIERLSKEWEAMGGVMGENKSKLELFLNNIAEHNSLREVLDKARAADDLEFAEMTASDPDLLKNIADNMRLLEAQKEKLQAQGAKERAAVEVLEARKDSLTEAIAAEDALSKDRRARISPEELVCHVTTADPSWDYVILDGGVDKGIVIGSRLAVMRGDKKICELNVTLVEATRSSCDVVLNTLITGEAVHAGDRVVSVRPEPKN